MIENKQSREFILKNYFMKQNISKAQKLVLKKETIIYLDSDKLNSVIGGKEGLKKTLWSQCISRFASCLDMC